MLRPIQNGDDVRQAEHVRHEVAGHVHRVDEEVAVLDADVDVRAEDQQLLGEVVHVLLDAEVALERRDLLRHPRRERVRAGRGDHQAVRPARSMMRGGAYQFGAGLGGGLADLGADLDHRLVQLGLDLLAEDELAVFEDLRDVRLQLPRVAGR